MITTIIITSLGLPLALIMLNTTISKKSLMEREKPSAFECGFDPKSSARLPFSLRFYLIAVIFLIFDVEITLIIPIPVIMMLNNTMVVISMACFFMFILITGLYHEWNQGALEWK
uniref:NADH-ubiquinone oxidoreductase chain 3 n=1 Tax=Cryptopygus antarcticus TaxID=187623 RepID=B2BSB8_CRYAT|nr:NADH dehydrogenase subunit 3 [Cryptopygus antarcticus]ABS57571.1 NADH dehydrogenase subunit 3 [Cryptopygus antarcticus]